MPGSVCPEELLEKLRRYCNWASLPQDLLSSRAGGAAGSTHTTNTPSSNSNSSSDSSQLTAFLQHLTTLVPFEWSVQQQAVFDTGGIAASSSTSRRLPPVMHAPAVGTPAGLVCFGGVVLGGLQEVRVEHESSWIKNSEPAGLAPDHSRVYQGTSSSSSRQVVAVRPSSSKPGTAWAAAPLSPALDAGLLGHSVALWGSRAFIFGGMQDSAAGTDDNKLAPGTPTRRPTNRLRAFAVEEAGTQGGLLPVLSDVPQLGAVPSCRMYHSAAVDPEGGVMYVYGGVNLQAKNNARVPADSEAGLLHAFDFDTYTWTTVKTTGDPRPCSTTLLALFWHGGALWAIPDLPRPHQQASSSSSNSSGGRSRSGRGPGGYRLLRLCMSSKQWQLVPCEGAPPSQRVDACALYHPTNQELLVYGGRQVSSPFSLLADIHSLTLPDSKQQQQQQQGGRSLQKPVWRQVQPTRLAAGGGSVGPLAPHHQQPQPQQQGGMLPLAGHSGGVVGAVGEVVYVGGYRRNDVKEPQPLLQVLTKAVRPPTPDAAKLAAVVSQQQLALQHVRMQLARMVKQAYPAQVLLQPDGAGVRLPARLLALYSCLFDELFQGMLEDSEQDDQQQQQQPAAAAAAAGSTGRVPQRPAHVVPVPGVGQDVIAAVCRWMMGLLALRSCSVATLVDMYRVSDRLVMEQLMVEVLEELTARELLPQEAAAVMALAGDFPGAGDAARRSAAQQLQQAVSPATAPSLMALARAQGNAALQERCVEVMGAARKGDPYGVLDFALRFNLRSLQGSCLGSIRRASRDQLVHRAERIMQVVRRHQSVYGPDPSRVPVVQMLERDLVNELEGADLRSLPSYTAVCERLCLVVLWEGLVEHMARQEVWALLQQPQHKGVLQHLQQRHGRMYTAVMQQRNRNGSSDGFGGRPREAGAAAAAAAAADAAMNLLGPAQSTC